VPIRIGGGQLRVWYVEGERERGGFRDCESRGKGDHWEADRELISSEQDAQNGSNRMGGVKGNENSLEYPCLGGGLGRVGEGQEVLGLHRLSERKGKSEKTSCNIKGGGVGHNTMWGFGFMVPGRRVGWWTPRRIKGESLSRKKVGVVGLRMIRMGKEETKTVFGSRRAGGEVSILNFLDK